ncbi:hypothetical protein LXL04_009167 [Taraxacum kok-saghyz]
MGRDQAKQKAKVSGSTSSTNTTRSEELIDIKDEFSKLNSTLQKHMQFSVDRNREIKKQHNKGDVFMRDVSHLTGEELQATMKVKDIPDMYWILGVGHFN